MLYVPPYQLLVPIASGQAMQIFGQQLAHDLLFADLLSIPTKSAFIIHLVGTLGAGKTTLCQGIISGLGYNGRVKSPTYTLVESYELHLLPIARVHHFDFYRVHHPGELEYFGIRDYFSSGALCLFEWPDRAGNLAGNPDLLIEIKLDSENPDVRQLNLYSTVLELNRLKCASLGTLF